MQILKGIVFDKDHEAPESDYCPKGCKENKNWRTNESKDTHENSHSSQASEDKQWSITSWRKKSLRPADSTDGVSYW